MPTAPRALLSVTDKSGLLDFAAGLVQLGWELISTGGTAKMLRDKGLAVKDVSEVTGFPEMLDGRVKTIHPLVAAGVLARRSVAEHMSALAEHGIGLIDMVVVNLYAFEKAAADPGASIEHLIENIDIGGPTMIRAAAKNFEDVAVVTVVEDYAAVLAELQANGNKLSKKTHWNLARKAFATTAKYDSAITTRLSSIEVEDGAFQDTPGELPKILNIHVPLKQALRYGENPHQSAALYAQGNEGVANCTQLHGKELSFNNLVDLDAAWQLVCEFEKPAASIIKHTNPCGCAEQPNLADAYRKALEADTVSAFGGVLAFNREVDEDTALEVSKLFVEAIAAPCYSQKAMSVLAAKKNLRLVKIEGTIPPGLVVKSISGGYLAQSADALTLDPASLRVVTDREPTAAEMSALTFAWKICKHVKSNAIVYARDGQLLSSGAGQMSRVFSAEIGARKSMLPLEGCAVASDAFFPFPDGLEVVVKNGATSVIQPGGSVRDDEVIAAANRLGIAMVFTGLRHFRH